MKRLIVLTVSLVLAAGSAAAQGTFSKPPKSTFGSWAPAPKAPASPPLADAYRPRPAPAAKPKSATAPEPASPPAFKPYEPWKPTPPTSQFGPDGRPRR